MTRAICRPFALWLLAVLVSGGCAGYRVGQQALYRPDVQSVHVPIFESTSFRRNLGEQLAEAVAREIELKTPYRVTTAERADSVLRGRILSETKRVIAEDQYDIPRLIQTEMVCQIDWIGPQGELLANRIAIPIDAFDLRVAQNEAFVPEAGQSLATAHRQLINDLAEQIVAQMEMPPW